MKILTMLATGAVAASALFAAVPANAQHRDERHRERVVVRHDGPRMHHRKVCTTRYEHHRRVRICR